MGVGVGVIKKRGSELTYFTHTRTPRMRGRTSFSANLLLGAPQETRTFNPMIQLLNSTNFNLLTQLITSTSLQRFAVHDGRSALALWTLRIEMNRRMELNHRTGMNNNE